MLPLSSKWHKCNEKCICPIHKTPMYYNVKFNEHACQDINCVYVHGYERKLNETFL